MAAASPSLCSTGEGGDSNSTQCHTSAIPALYGVQAAWSVQLQRLFVQAGELCDPSACFVHCCSDVVCDYPLKEMLEFHRARDAEATILVTKVRNARS